MKALLAVLAFSITASAAFAGEKINCVVSETNIGSKVVAVELSTPGEDANAYKTLSGTELVTLDNDHEVMVTIQHIQSANYGDWYKVSASAQSIISSVALESKRLEPMSATASGLTLSVNCSK